MKQDIEWLKKIQQWEEDGKIIMYLDEVGTGSLAGPIYTCGVVLKDTSVFSEIVTDSKKFASNKKALYKVAKVIKEKVRCYSLGINSVEEINIIGNIHTAKMLAFKRSVELSKVKPDVVIIDGPYKIKDIDIEQHAVVKGDGRIFGVACASIIAKQERDFCMHELHKQYPYYGWDTNVGYGSAGHFKGMKEKGITEYHRLFFKGVKNYLV